MVTMTAIEQLIGWAQEQGAILNGITARKCSLRGIGIVSTRPLEAGEVILSIPAKLLRTLENTPKPIVDKLKGASTHGILAASLCLDETEEFLKWKAVFPARHEIMPTLPICWPQSKSNHLPLGAQTPLATQRGKFDLDWRMVKASYPSLAKQDYLYYWVLVNTRSFYLRTRGSANTAASNSMCLQPVADFFNTCYGDGYCTAVFDGTAFVFTTTRAYKHGEEVFVRYGLHSNDKFLVEYGFLPLQNHNPWDETPIDQFICPLFTAEQREILQNEAYWGGYVIDRDGICHRTQVAVRMLFLSLPQWRDLLDGTRDMEEDQKTANVELVNIFTVANKFSATAMKLAERDLGEADGVTSRLIKERLRQVDDLHCFTLAPIYRAFRRQTLQQ